MEMIVCILFFSLSAAVSAQMFAKSHVISEAAINENHAVIEVNNLAEAFYSEHGDIEAISEKFYDGNTLLSSHILGVYFDKDFNPVGPIEYDAHYEAQLDVKDSETEGMKDGTITFYEFKEGGAEPIYSLNVTVNVPHMVPSNF